jgi:DNA-binding XRE family transcriptional regulator
MTERNLSPIGRAASEDVERWRAEDPEFRAAQDELAPYREIATQVILLRTRHGISQEELARRVGTSKSAIVRLESGRHRPNMETLRRVAAAFGGSISVTITVPESDERGPSSAAFAT